MKTLYLIGLCASLLMGTAQAAEIQILSPPVVANAGLKTIADAFTR